MNQILKWLSGGDLRSDGMADKAAELVLENPELLAELFEGLYSPDDVIRGRTADALEKIARNEPGFLIKQTPEIIKIAINEEVPMVQMHLAMLFGHLVPCGEYIEEIAQVLIRLLAKGSAFTKSWGITSLCIIAVKYPERQRNIFEEIAKFQDNQSIAVRTRVRKGLAVLGREGSKFPKGWIKSKHLQDL